MLCSLPPAAPKLHNKDSYEPSVGLVLQSANLTNLHTRLPHPSDRNRNRIYEHTMLGSCSEKTYSPSIQCPIGQLSGPNKNNKFTKAISCLGGEQRLESLHVNCNVSPAWLEQRTFPLYLVFGTSCVQSVQAAYTVQSAPLGKTTSVRRGGCRARDKHSRAR